MERSELESRQIRKRLFFSNKFLKIVHFTALIFDNTQLWHDNYKHDLHSYP